MYKVYIIVRRGESRGVVVHGFHSSRLANTGPPVSSSLHWQIFRTFRPTEKVIPRLADLPVLDWLTYSCADASRLTECLRQERRHPCIGGGWECD